LQKSKIPADREAIFIESVVIHPELRQSPLHVVFKKIPFVACDPLFRIHVSLHAYPDPGFYLDVYPGTYLSRFRIWYKILMQATGTYIILYNGENNGFSPVCPTVLHFLKDFLYRY